MPTDTSTITKQETVEVINEDGSPVQHNANLDAIFSKIEGGKAAEDAIKEVMVDPPAQQKEEPLFPDKKEDAPPPKDATVAPDATKKADETVVPEDKKDEPKAVDEEPVSEEELTVQPHDKPKTAKRIRALLSKIDQTNATHATTVKELADKATRLAALEDELKKSKSADPVVTDEIKQQLMELKMYRRRYELDKDPEVQQKFDSRLTSSEDQIQKTLADRGAGESLLKIIKEEGGWAKFAESNRSIRVNEADGPRDITATELASNILQNLTYRERAEIQALVIEQAQTKREKQRFFDEETKNADSYFEQRNLEAQRAQEASQQEIATNRQMIQDWQKKMYAENDFLKIREVPANATPEEKAMIEEDNKYTKQIHGIANKYVASKTIPEMLEAIGDAIRYHQERRENSRLLNKVKALEAKAQEYDRYRAASKTTPKQGSLVGGGTPPPEGHRTEKRARTLEEALERIEQGESPDTE